MKKIMIAFVGLFALMLVGCKTTPTTDTMYATSYMIGGSTGMVMNNADIDNDSRNEIIAIVNEVKGCTPEAGQTFKEAWTPIAERHVAKLIEDGKIDKEKEDLILSAFNTVVMGIDYLFDVRYPQAKVYKDLTEAAINGFCTGLLETYKPANDALRATPKKYDERAYKFLMDKVSK